mmetsp:Transcript_126724/g.354804  ORF Transcript_126724/g.354804 Transcript_126724/m.354804 type:complete len:303 (-) Transcript_126724:192-1100(-)
MHKYRCAISSATSRVGRRRRSGCRRLFPRRGTATQSNVLFKLFNAPFSKEMLHFQDDAHDALLHLADVAPSLQHDHEQDGCDDARDVEVHDHLLHERLDEAGPPQSHEACHGNNRKHTEVPHTGPAEATAARLAAVRRFVLVLRFLLASVVMAGAEEDAEHEHDHADAPGYEGGPASGSRDLTALQHGAQPRVLLQEAQLRAAQAGVLLRGAPHPRRRRDRGQAGALQLGVGRASPRRDVSGRLEGPQEAQAEGCRRRHPPDHRLEAVALGRLCWLGHRKPHRVHPVNNPVGRRGRALQHVD